MNDFSWMIPLSAAVFLAFYLYHVPVMIAFALGAGRAGVGIGAFLYGNAAARAQRRAAGIGRRRKRKMSFSVSAQDAFLLFRYLFSKGKMEFLRVSGIISFENAMETALAYGLVLTAACIFRERADISVRPDFILGKTNVEGVGIVSVKLGHITRAAVLYAGMILKRRGAQYGKASD